MRKLSMTEYTPHNTAQNDYSYSNANDNENTNSHVHVSYESAESFQEYVYQCAIQSGSLFNAILTIREVEDLNGGKVLSDYQMAKVKDYFRNVDIARRKSRNQNLKRQREFRDFSNCGNEKVKNKVEPLQPLSNRSENIIIKSEILQKEKVNNRMLDLQKEIQKGYMDLLSK